MDKELITKLADDVWEAAKELESENFELSERLKTMSSCLHDIRTGSCTKWYENGRHLINKKR